MDTTRTAKTAARFFITIREHFHADPERIDLSAETEHGAKSEARKHQRHLGSPARRIALFEQCDGFGRCRGELVGAAKEWRA